MKEREEGRKNGMMVGQPRDGGGGEIKEIEGNEIQKYLTANVSNHHEKKKKKKKPEIAVQTFLHENVSLKLTDKTTVTFKLRSQMMEMG
jgi:hypothetical protein